MEYTVAIIDDEENLRLRLKNLIKDNEYGFCVKHEYENGIDALEGIANDPVDLVIADIRLPFIEGIELVRKLKKELPDLKTIFITGYNEIDYAKQAIELESLGFISKPITPDEIQAALRKAKAKIDALKDLNQTVLELDTLRKINLPSIKENDLYHLLQATRVTSELIEKMKKDQISLDYNHFLIGVFDHDILYEQVDLEKSEIAFLSMKKYLEITFKKTIDFDLIKRGVNFVIILKSMEPFIKTRIEEIFSTQIGRIDKYLNLSISIAFSQPFTLDDSFKDHFIQAKNTLDLRTIVGGKQVLFFEPSDEEKTILIDKSFFKDLSYLIRYQSIEGIKTYLEKVNAYVIKNFKKTSFYLFLFELINKIISSCDSVDALKQRGYDLDSIYRFIYEVKTVDQLYDWVIELILAVKAINNTLAASIVEKNLKRIYEYIHENYDDQNISLEMLSEGVGISQSYISALLKKERQTSFVKLITSLRMEKAKSLLLNPNNKIIDIALAVGYHEPYYFSHCFKKHEGKSPKEYRESHARKAA